jgi:hypothetical protein
MRSFTQQRKYYASAKPLVLCTSGATVTTTEEALEAQQPPQAQPPKTPKCVQCVCVCVCVTISACVSYVYVYVIASAFVSVLSVIFTF